MYLLTDVVEHLLRHTLHDKPVYPLVILAIVHDVPRQLFKAKSKFARTYGFVYAKRSISQSVC